MKVYRLLFFTVFSMSSHLICFETLQKVTSYAQSLEKPSKKKFDGKAFRSILDQVVEKRENIGYYGQFVVKITPYPNTTFIVWGPLKGAFTSLVTSLQYIHSLGIIDNELQLTNKATYLVFTGDIVFDKPYSLETMTLILSLMKKNPKNVIVIKGDAEQGEHWKNTDLKAELNEKISRKTEEKVPATRQVTNFFNTLPLALYITGPEPREGSIRISFFSRDFPQLSETDCGALLTDKTINTPQICYLDTPQKGPDTVKAIIKAEQRLMSYAHHQGLSLIAPDKGAVSWSIFSGPTERYQKEYDFYNHAFAIIGIGKTIGETKIALYTTDMRTPQPISFIASYNLLTGIQLPTTTTPPTTKSTLAQLTDTLRSSYKQMNSLLSDITNLNEALAQKSLRPAS